MKPLLIAFGVAGLVLGLGSSSRGQQNERVYPIFELTDEDVALIDVEDGSIEDWLEVVGEPALTALDFQTISLFGPYDPASMDFRIWLAWHDDTNRIYGALERTDDVYVNEYNGAGYGAVDRIPGFHDGSIEFYVDGDRSGGVVTTTTNELDIFEQAQMYSAIAEVYDQSSHVVLWPSSPRHHWYITPPFALGGGRAFGEKPTVTATEFYVTPFDRLIRDSPEESRASDLRRGASIGLGIVIHDYDTKPGYSSSIHFLSAWAWLAADQSPEGLLVGPEGEVPGVSAVESITWARIKARFIYSAAKVAD